LSFEFPEWEGVDPSWVPIVPVTARWDDRTQLPLTTAWAITIHKSQGLTLARVVIDLGPKDFSAGLSFVAISRVKTLKGLAFHSPFALPRLQRSSVTETRQMLYQDEARRNQLGFTLDTYGMDLDEFVFLD
jgi:ATP-dependent DNA helicase PIF1